MLNILDIFFVPTNAVVVKSLPCCVTFCMNVVASALEMIGAKLKSSTSAEETGTGTVWFVHTPAVAAPASTIAAAIVKTNMFVSMWILLANNSVLLLFVLETFCSTA